MASSGPAEPSLLAYSLTWVFSAWAWGRASFMLRFGSGRNYVRLSCLFFSHDDFGFFPPLFLDGPSLTSFSALDRSWFSHILFWGWKQSTRYPWSWGRLSSFNVFLLSTSLLVRVSSGLWFSGSPWRRLVYSIAGSIIWQSILPFLRPWSCISDTARSLWWKVWRMRRASKGREDWQHRDRVCSLCLNSFDVKRALEHWPWIGDVVCAAVGFALWAIDSLACEQLRWARRRIGMPLGFVLEFHGW